MGPFNIGLTVPVADTATLKLSTLDPEAIHGPAERFRTL
jgi:hypothetical protein